MMTSDLLDPSNSFPRRPQRQRRVANGSRLRTNGSRRLTTFLGMSYSHATAILAATMMAVATSILGWLASQQIAGSFQAAVSENIPSLLTAQELEVSLLEQRGFVAAYLLDDGNEDWLEDLQRRKQRLKDWMIRARATAHTASETQILSQLEGVYRQYDQKRDEVVELFESGDAETAKRILLRDVQSLYLENYDLCEQFVTCNERSIQAAMAKAQVRAFQVACTLGVSTALTFAIGMVLLWYSIRKSVAEQRNRTYELRLLAAREVQQQLLPETPPTSSGLDFGMVWHPAEFAAGDYVDYVPMADGAIGVVIGDVSGHGLDAALLAVATRANLRSLAQSHGDVGTILASMNAVSVCDGGGEGRFVTLLLARLDLQNHTLTYGNAGHPPGYVFDASGELKARMEGESFPLGILSDADFPTHGPIQLARGDIVVLLTDGVLEAGSANREMFGTDRVLDVVRAHRTRSAQDISEALYHAVRQHVGRDSLTDDPTATVVKIKDRQ